MAAPLRVGIAAIESAVLELASMIYICCVCSLIVAPNRKRWTFRLTFGWPSMSVCVLTALVGPRWWLKSLSVREISLIGCSAEWNRCMRREPHDLTIYCSISLCFISASLPVQFVTFYQTYSWLEVAILAWGGWKTLIYRDHSLFIHCSESSGSPFWMTNADCLLVWTNMSSHEGVECTR